MSTIIGERIRSLRVKLHMTQSQLAEITGYSDKTAISRIENGENKLTQTKIQMFADALGTDPLFLMGYVNEPSAKATPTATGKQIKKQSVDFDIETAYRNADPKTQKAVRVLLGIE